MSYKGLKTIQDLLERVEQLHRENKITISQGIQIVNFFEDRQSDYLSDNGRRYTKSQELNEYIGFDADKLI